MNSVFCFVALCLALTSAAPRERRQVVNCVDPFQNVPSPCKNNPTNIVYFPHPTDNSKFIQCDIYDRMYIIQCPQGEVYDSQLVACRPVTPVTAAPAPITARPTFRPIITAAPVTQAPVVINTNPCNANALARGQIYFAVATNRSQFIECDLLANPNLLVCPSGLYWDQGILSCVYPIQAGAGAGVINGNQGSTLPPTLLNPCTTQAISSGRLFFPHPDANKFIQCDLWGQTFVVSCPTNLVWNAIMETCNSAANTGIIIGK